MWIYDKTQILNYENARNEGEINKGRSTTLVSYKIFYYYFV